MKKLIAAILAIFLFFPTVCHAWKGNVISSSNSGKMQIALTFDDGPHPKYTPEILDILKEYGIKATFFIIGENIESSKEIIKREIDEGHEIGNHTFSHKSLNNADSTFFENEVIKTGKILFEEFGYKATLLRPPGGAYNEKTLCKLAEENGYKVVLWSVDTRDWSHPTVEDICENVFQNIKDGSIILFHDFIGGKPSPTPAALRKIIKELINRGYEFVTVSELVR